MEAIVQQLLPHIAELPFSQYELILHRTFPLKPKTVHLDRPIPVRPYPHPMVSGPALIP
jgi:hypothetical protein